jgi:hypothetical protein
LIQFRRDSYAAVFDGIIEEENELSALYEPRALLEAAKTHLLSVWERGSQSGSLEDPQIRRQVCEILEGGEAAFKERAQRLRIRMT